MNELKPLFDWYESNGGEVLDAYELYDFKDTGRGVRANRNVEKGERFVQVPKGIQFTAPWIISNCKSVVDFIKKGETEVQIDSWDLMTLFLLFERQGDS